MNPATQLIYTVEEHGGRFRIEGESLVVAPRKAWEPFADQLRQYKPQIIDALKEREIAAWREPFTLWMNSSCVRHGRFFTNVASLYRSFAQWQAEQNASAPTLAVLERLLTKSDFLIADVQGVWLVSGLAFRDDLKAAFRSQEEARR
jgi:hypothetical protein